MAKLKDQIEGEWVAFDKHGRVVQFAVPEDFAPATLSVSPVTDALKRVDEADRVVGSVDKGSVWMVDVILLSSTVLGRLPDDVFTAEELLEAVREAGFVWQVSPTSVP